jgi:hypothetical protein
MKSRDDNMETVSPGPLGRDMLHARVIGGPRFGNDGHVHFRVEVGGVEVEALDSPMGIGFVDCDDLEAGSAALRAVSEYIDEHKTEQLEWYRKAAQCRRQAGVGRLAGNTRASGVTLMRAPTRTGRGVVEFPLAVWGVPLKVTLVESVALLDDCEQWDLITDSDRDAAMGVVLDYVCDHEDELRGLRVDVSMVKDLWC